ncbi:SIS domain-containing protein [uncultured Paraglaciecola sp.]|uniref:SIS domain-containing protein n=1 Tax=uncultured Paraglaciecola sp. TaxID=1765024 RepID=UPI00261F2879|nr:SIS domain-containing protein [uncultured Paraglaciecola sp.]
MSIFEAIVNHFNEHIDATSRSIDSLTPYIAEATHLLAQTLTEDKKIICIAAPSCFAAGQQFCHNLLGNNTLARPALPAIFLNNSNTAAAVLSNDDHQQIHATQISALGQEGDLLLIFSFSGEEAALAHAMNAASNRQMNIVSIASGKATTIANQTPKDQVHIPMHGFNIQQSINLHFVLAQMLSELIEQQLFGNLNL